MSKYNEKIGQGKLGVNLIRSFTDENQCYFNEIKQENDVGIDAYIEFTQNGENNGKNIAVQIKTGDSYFNTSKTIGNISIGNHYTYWKNHSLPVYGIICDCNLKIAYWVSISNYIKYHAEEIESGKIKSISFPLMEINLLNKETFNTVFKQIVYGKLPILSYDYSMHLTYSEYSTEKLIAVDVLSSKYADKIETWERLFDLLNAETDYHILFELVKYLSYIPHHPDLCGKLNFSDDSYQYGTNRIKTLDYPLFIKLISIIGKEGIARGTIGQCVESIISLNPNRENILIRIIDEHSNKYIAINSFLILAYYNPKYILKHELYFKNNIGEIAESVIGFVKEFGSFELYI